GEDRRPFSGLMVERRVVDADPLPEGQVPTEVCRRRLRADPERGEQEAPEPVTPPPGHQRHGEQHGRRDVADGVSYPHTASRAPGIRPVGEAGDRGGYRRDDPDADQRVRGRTSVLPPEDVEEERARPRTDGEIREDRM